jgi:hypothetical protein
LVGFGVGVGPPFVCVGFGVLLGGGVGFLVGFGVPVAGGGADAMCSGWLRVLVRPLESVTVSVTT